MKKFLAYALTLVLASAGWAYPQAIPNPAGSSGGANVEYDEGDIDTTITGVAIMWEDVNDVLRAISAANPLPVDLGTNNDVTLNANSGVDIGDVDVKSVIPGTGATNLGKAIDDVAGATDVGVAMLGKHDSNINHLSSAEGDYDVVRLSDFGAVQTSPEQHHSFDDMNVTTGWAVLSTDTINLATTKKHVVGTDALTFDKADGDANTIFAGIEKTITTTDLGDASPHDLIQTTVYIPDLTNVAYIFMRVGTNSSNYNEWRIDDTDLTAAVFTNIIFVVGDANNAGITGDGWNPASLSYLAVGVAFDAETNALAGIIYDHVGFHTNQHTTSQLTAEVSSSVSSANINLQKVGGSATDKNSGNKSAGSQRIVIATDDVNLSAIKTAVELDLMLGTDFSAVLGANDIMTTGEADNVPAASDLAQVAAFGYLHDGTNWDRAPGTTADGALTNLGGNNDVVLTAGLLHADSPITLIDTFSLFDGSGETQIATTNLGASKAYAVPGTGRLVKLCTIISLGTPFAEDFSVIFFDTDPSITIEDASLTLVQAQNTQAIISFSGSDARDNFATVKINCQFIDEPYSSISHVVFASEGATTYDDEDIEIRLWYKRES